MNHVTLVWRGFINVYSGVLVRRLCEWYNMYIYFLRENGLTQYRNDGYWDNQKKKGNV